MFNSNLIDPEQTWRACSNHSFSAKHVDWSLIVVNVNIDSRKSKLGLVPFFGSWFVATLSLVTARAPSPLPARRYRKSSQSQGCAETFERLTGFVYCPAGNTSFGFEVLCQRWHCCYFLCQSADPPVD